MKEQISDRRIVRPGKPLRKSPLPPRLLPGIAAASWRRFALAPGFAMNRIALLRQFGRALFLLTPLLAGCIPFIPVYYAYPTAAFIPAVPAAASPAEVRAFRVDVADEQNCIDFPEHDRYVLTPVSLSRAGSVPPQMLVALDYGWVWNCIALIFDGHTHHTVMVRLYRPGFRTVEIQAGQKEGRADWEKTADAAAQEKAVDDLLSTWGTNDPGRQWADDHNRDLPPTDWKVFASLAPGSSSSGHRRTLLFAASEYERLAAGLGDDEPAQRQRARLADKAKALRELAGK